MISTTSSQLLPSSSCSSVVNYHSANNSNSNNNNIIIIDNNKDNDNKINNNNGWNDDDKNGNRSRINNSSHFLILSDEFANNSNLKIMPGNTVAINDTDNDNDHNNCNNDNNGENDNDNMIVGNERNTEDNGRTFKKVPAKRTPKECSTNPVDDSNRTKEIHKRNEGKKSEREESNLADGNDSESLSKRTNILNASNNNPLEVFLSAPPILFITDSNSSCNDNDSIYQNDSRNDEMTELAANESDLNEYEKRQLKSDIFDYNCQQQQSVDSLLTAATTTTTGNNNTTKSNNKSKRKLEPTLRKSSSAEQGYQGSSIQLQIARSCYSPDHPQHYQSSRCLSSVRIPLKSALKATKSDAYLLNTGFHHPVLSSDSDNSSLNTISASQNCFYRSLSKSDLLELRRTISKSDFKQVQDPLSRPKLKRNSSLDCPPGHDFIFRIDAVLPNHRDYGRMPPFYDATDSEEGDFIRPSVLFPSMRLLIAALLCCCFITLSISSSNMAVALICMTSCSMHGYGGELEWHSEEEGFVLAAQNAGSLLMVVTGLWADRINGKWMVGGSLVLCALANAALPVMARENFWYAVAARLAVGAADACLSPAANSLITRWFPHTERAAAIGIITGGRQIGTLFILPTAGYLCTRKDILNGWPAIFYLSAMIAILVTLFWLPMGADKPSKQGCISRQERLFIESRIACESIGKRTAPRHVPWSAICRSPAVWAGVFALVCHEYPLVIMLQFLPNYMRDILQFAPAKNGIVSALPIACLFISKTLSSSLSTWLTEHTTWTKSKICKIFNGIASAGLSICVLAVPQFDKNTSFLAIIALCGAMLFAGLHTPGVQTALVQLAPPFSGVITGLSFFVVAWFGIGNKILTKFIVRNGTLQEWATVFYVSGVIAALPVVVFTIWGSGERQWWSTPSSKASTHSLNTQATNVSN